MTNSLLRERIIQAEIRRAQTKLVSALGGDTNQITAAINAYEHTLKNSENPAGSTARIIAKLLSWSAEYKDTGAIYRLNAAGIAAVLLVALQSGLTEKHARALRDEIVNLPATCFEQL